MSYYNSKLQNDLKTLIPLEKSITTYKTDKEQILKIDFIKRALDEIGIKSITLDQFEKICNDIECNGEFKAIEPVLTKFIKEDTTINIEDLESHLIKIMECDLSKDEGIEFLLKHLSEGKNSISDKELFDKFIKESNIWLIYSWR